MMAEQPKAQGTRNQLISRGVIGEVSDTVPIPSLREQGIDENLAKRAAARAR